MSANAKQPSDEGELDPAWYPEAGLQELLTGVSTPESRANTAWWLIHQAMDAAGKAFADQSFSRSIQ